MPAIAQDTCARRDWTQRRGCAQQRSTLATYHIRNHGNQDCDARERQRDAERGQPPRIQEEHEHTRRLDDEEERGGRVHRRAVVLGPGAEEALQREPRARVDGCVVQRDRARVRRVPQDADHAAEHPDAVHELPSAPVPQTLTSSMPDTFE